MCNSDTGNWFGDCLSCKPGFFRQFDVATCLDFCPTGGLPIPLLNECADPGLIGAISTVLFNKLGPIYKGLPFGTYHLTPGVLGGLAPANTMDRGLFFDGGDGFVKITGIVLNSSFSAHYWVYFCTF